jgi:hypothetical protein
LAHVVWKLPVYNTVLKILTNPVDAGAYAWGRTKTLARIENGRKRLARGPSASREPRLGSLDHRASCRLHGLGRIPVQSGGSTAHNANMKGAMVRGAANRGSALLAGLLRLAPLRAQAARHPTRGTDGNVVRYDCRGSRINHGADHCISFGGLRADESVSREILARLQPLGVRAALEAIETAASQTDERIRQMELAQSPSAL